jgi:hypothetical protein
MTTATSRLPSTNLEALLTGITKQTVDETCSSLAISTDPLVQQFGAVDIQRAKCALNVDGLLGDEAAASTTTPSAKMPGLSLISNIGAEEKLIAQLWTMWSVRCWVHAHINATGRWGERAAAVQVLLASIPEVRNWLQWLLSVLTQSRYQYRPECCCGCSIHSHAEAWGPLVCFGHQGVRGQMHACDCRSEPA